MEALHDGRGLALTAANPQAVEAFEHALDLIERACARLLEEIRPRV